MGYLSLWCLDLAGNWPKSPINNRYCFGMFSSGVFFVWSGVPGGRFVNRCAVLHKGPAVAFFSP